MSLFAKPKLQSTAFSDFIRNAKSEERKRVYSKVLAQATDKQNRTLNAMKQQAHA
jgi:hypothetical protein